MKGRDPVTPLLAIEVLQRDQGCVGPRLGATDGCHGRIQIHHVKDTLFVGAPIVKRGPERRHRYRAPSRLGNLASVCEHHHEDGWAGANRIEILAYLRQRMEEAAA